MTRFRSLVTTVFISLGLVLVLAALPISGALSQGALSRGIKAVTALDTNGVLKLEGFNNQILTISNINKKYFYTGRITNGGREAIALKIKAMPDFSLVTNKAYALSIRIGGATLDYAYGTQVAQIMTLTVQPGQALDVEASLTGNQAREVLTIYEFTATSLSGSYVIHLLDSPTTPRRMIFR